MVASAVEGRRGTDDAPRMRLELGALAVQRHGVGRYGVFGGAPALAVRGDNGEVEQDGLDPSPDDPVHALCDGGDRRAAVEAPASAACR